MIFNLLRSIIIFLKRIIAFIYTLISHIFKGETVIRVDEELASLLEECKPLIVDGRKFANEAITVLEDTISSALYKLNENIQEIEQGNIIASNIDGKDITNELVEQLHKIKTDFEMLPVKLIDEVKLIPDESFVITLFGRTMVGKSTLMEVLTRGDGSSIGKGKPGTTRDVRSYEYKGLSVVDVPGVAAFGDEGRDDESIAFDAAKKSDLIIFLIDDDAPQPKETEYLRSILSMGKPVICLINVKADISAPSDMLLFRNDMNKKYESKHIEGIKNALYAYGDDYGQNWHNLPIEYVHLKSAHFYFSKNKKFKKSLRKELYEFSRFRIVEEFIISEIKKNGHFYKRKAFFDIVAVPMSDAVELYFDQSVQNYEHGKILKEKVQKLKKWKKVFLSDCDKRINGFCNSISSLLKKEIAEFAEEHYDNKNAGEDWAQIVKNHDIDTECNTFLNELSNECENELKEICREIDNEINFSIVDFQNKSIYGKSIIDGKGIWNWGVTLASAGLKIASFIVSGPIGWVAGAVAILGWLASLLFEDKEQKILDACKKMEEQLIKETNKMIIEIKNNIKEALPSITNNLDAAIADISKLAQSSFILSETQRELAISLNSKLNEINIELVSAALNYLGYTEHSGYICNAARLAGYAIMLIVKSKDQFHDKIINELSYLLQEEIYIIEQTDTISEQIFLIIGDMFKAKHIHIQNELCIATIFMAEHKLTQKMMNHIKLAQQLTNTVIMTK